MAIIRREGANGRRRSKAKKKKEKRGVSFAVHRREGDPRDPDKHFIKSQNLGRNPQESSDGEGQNALAGSSSDSLPSAVSSNASSFRASPDVSSSSTSSNRLDAQHPLCPVGSERESQAGVAHEETLGADGYFVEEDLEKAQKQLVTNNKIRGLLQSFRSSTTRQRKGVSSSSSPCFFDDYPHSEDEASEGASQLGASQLGASSPAVSSSRPSGESPAQQMSQARRGKRGREEDEDARLQTRQMNGVREGTASLESGDDMQDEAAAGGRERGPEKKGDPWRESERGGRTNTPPWLRADRSRGELDFFHRLHEECVDFIHWIDATEEEQQKRAKVLARVTAVARLLWDNCFVCPFGSSYTNLALPHADLDICIFIHSAPPLLEEFHELAAADTSQESANSSSPSVASYGCFGGLAEKVMAEASRCTDTLGYGSSMRRKKEEAARHLRRLAAVLSACKISLPSNPSPSASSGSAATRRQPARCRDFPLIRDMQLILEARVPICRFVDTETGLPVDISLDQPSAVLTSLYIRLQLLRFPLLRPLMLLNKTALKLWHLNEPFKGGVGSYLLFVMTLSFLQLNPRLYDRKMNQRYSLGHALFEFLHHYGVDFHYPTVGLSVRDKGRLFPKERRRWHYGQERDWGEGGKRFAHSTEFDRFLLAAESPLESTRDIGRGAYQMPQVRSAWRSAYARMVSRLREETSPSAQSLLTPGDSLLSALISPAVFGDRAARPASDANFVSSGPSAVAQREEAEGESDDEASFDCGVRREPAGADTCSAGPPSAFRSVCGLRAVKTQPSRAELETERRRLEATLLSSGKTRAASGPVVGERNKRGLKLLKKKMQQLEKEQRRLVRARRDGSFGRPRQNTQFFFEADSDAERDGSSEDLESETDPARDAASPRAKAPNHEEGNLPGTKLRAPALVSLLSSSSSESDASELAAGNAPRGDHAGLRRARAPSASSGEESSETVSPWKRGKGAHATSTGLRGASSHSAGSSISSRSSALPSEDSDAAEVSSSSGAKPKRGEPLRFGSRSSLSARKDGRATAPACGRSPGNGEAAEPIVLSSSSSPTDSEAEERRGSSNSGRKHSSGSQRHASSSARRGVKSGQAGGGEATESGPESPSGDTEGCGGRRRGEETDAKESSALRAFRARTSLAVVQFQSFDLGSREAEETAGSALTHLAQRTACGGGWEGETPESD
ncbi:conserved hypothetical protein [Neospora caninum Liverpool]|uniref:DNA-directed DNA polymerase n=1 Tax=Neospora caninum (strain Liverpool) TaxID=572307 RepID=F0VCJ0_NEOCL|nr:conserved hypothetical protein [Neospora caninum Liverpool]CBZ51679.1 conserved hypothetical protein [Neospora caninum Liverpool]CEL65633.1 TPA: DNA-directed DNA polymerase [Neospora caninum Liverpool]|eukprot:XP_003881712.1 conserved hypothetical protein [Neospora caninum Liverpool]